MKQEKRKEIEKTVGETQYHHQRDNPAEKLEND